MTRVNCLQGSQIGKSFATGVQPADGESSLHRLRTVRLQEELSVRTVAGRLGVTMTEVRRQESETVDLLLSSLHRWRAALDVPLTELLVEPDCTLSPPIGRRAQWVRIMKSVKYVMEQSDQKRVTRMAENLVGQLLEIMPELQGIRPWHAVGSRDARNGCGRAALFPLPDSMFAGAED